MPTAGRTMHYFAVVALVLVSARASSGGEIMQRSRGRPPKAKGRLVPSLREYRLCTDKKQHLTDTDIKIELNKSGEELWMVNWNYSKTAKSFQRFRIVINKCTLNNDHACEYWNTWSWDTAVCSLLQLNNTVWAPLVQNITPKFRCPVKAGHYAGVNATMNFDILDATARAGAEGVEQHSWRIEFELYNELRELHTCIHFVIKCVRLISRT